MAIGDNLMRNSDMRFAKARCCDEAQPIATIWCDQQSEAELQAEIAEREAKGFRVIVLSWQR
jgi:hypothetical protein